jgi:hypothetical protein
MGQLIKILSEIQIDTINLKPGKEYNINGTKLKYIGLSNLYEKDQYLFKDSSGIKHYYLKEYILKMALNKKIQKL